VHFVPEGSICPTLPYVGVTIYRRWSYQRCHSVNNKQACVKNTEKFIIMGSAGLCQLKVVCR